MPMYTQLQRENELVNLKWDFYTVQAIREVIMKERGIPLDNNEFSAWGEPHTFKQDHRVYIYRNEDNHWWILFDEDPPENAKELDEFTIKQGDRYNCYYSR